MKVNFWMYTIVVAVALLAACGGRSDAELKTAAESALKGDPSTANVTVEVKNGEATVAGEVADDAAKARAAELAQVEGVTSVKNDVTVAPAPPPTASAEDPVQKTKIEEALKAKNCGDLEVEVKDGKAILRGSISQSKLAECMMAVQETKPKSVDNQLKVEN